MNANNLPEKNIEDTRKRIYEFIVLNMEKMSNPQYYEVIGMYGGFLTKEQRMELNKKYAKIDGDRQIANHDINSKFREEYFNKHLDIQFDESLPMNSSYNMKIATKKAEDESLLNKAIEAFNEVKNTGLSDEAYKIRGDNRVVNLRSKNVIVEYNDGTIHHFNENVEKARMEEYKKHLNKMRDNNFISTKDDPEYE